ncbi:MAG: anthranilate phosphoribosyltransferase, partial [Dehalococcoidia bacterium]
MQGEATPAQIGAFVTALRLKGETPEEIAGLASEMRRHSLKVRCDGPVIDTCGTGGDLAGTFNVSTAAALVAAATGAKVAKHGNVAASSKSGSADVLDALGAKVVLTPDEVATCVREVGFGFMHAQAYHPALKHVGGPRRELGFRTVFNVLGPLTNPAGAEAQLLGAPSPALAEKLARVLALLGTRRAMVVHSEDGLDELSLGAGTLIYEVCGDEVRQTRVTPEDAGLTPAPRASVRGGEPAANAEAMRRVFTGQDGPMRDFVLLNASAALVVAGLAENLHDGATLAAKTIDSGAAIDTLERYVRLTRSFDDADNGD